MIFNERIISGGSGSIELDSIAVTTPPTKTKYAPGDSFDPTGMVITATYTNGATKTVSNYTVTPDPLTLGTTAVSISYTEDGVTKTTTQPVSVFQFSIHATLPASVGTTVTATDGVDTYSATTEAPGVLPDGYTELEYLVFNGTQYIIPDVIPTTNMTAKGKVLWDSGASNKISSIYYAWDSARGTRTTMWGSFGSSSNFICMLGQDPHYTANNSISMNTIYEFEVKHGSQITLKLNGTTMPLTVRATNPTNTTTPLYIGGTDQTADRFLYGRIYYLSFYDDSMNLIGNFVPARRNSDSVLGMYDTVRNQFYTKSVGGNFAAGPEITCANIDVTHTGTYTVGAGWHFSTASVTVVEGTEEYNVTLERNFTALEYIGFSGTQYIATSVIPTANMTAEGTVSFGSSTKHETVYYAYRTSPYSRTAMWRDYAQAAFGIAGADIKISAANTSQANVIYRFSVKHGSQSTMTINDVPMTLTSTGSETINTTNNITIGGTMAFERYLYGKIYSIAFYDDSMIAMGNFIPVRRASDSVIGMYDTVSGTMYTNAGSGTFVAGPDLPDAA